MPSVENRVVRMEFDNATFQAKIKQTLDSLSQLDKALKMEGAQKGLTDIGKAANSVDLGPVQTSVQKVSAGFLALSTIAVTALATITHAAINAGTQMVRSFSFGPILDGFKEFETNVGSIQTILSNTRADNTGLADVNAALDKLNEFSDKTIFNFGEMARNIGTFTAAGVDLQTSVDSIKGIANLAAISGSSSEQAATAMYQLSQAISTGTVRLMDWNSVVNAGMGGEVFQKALFESGKALKTINDVPINQTFEEWTAAGHSFRDSLQEGWLTSEVLTTTLQGFTGEMTEAQLLAKGFTKEQAANLLEMGQVGLEAATKIRTFSQLLTTIKETVGSGWSQTFRTVIGDFNESTDLFTGINDVVSKFVNAQADARNQILQSWKDMGGRTLLIQGLKDAFGALADVIKPIKEAFSNIFPPATAQSLFKITQSFAEFAHSLKPSETTIENISRIFKGLFSVLDLGWEVIKAGVVFLKDLIIQITGLGSGRLLEFTADVADFFTSLRDGLDQGRDIKRFFDNLTEALQGPIEFIKDLKDSIAGLFDGFDDGAAEAVEVGVSRFGVRIEALKSGFDRLESVGERFRDFMGVIMNVLETVGSAIGDWFSELGQKIADSMEPGDFDAVLDALNVSLLGGIGLLIAKWLQGGINFDIGEGLFSKISDAFGELTGVLDAMQTQIRAEALEKIAIAVGILTASVVALSLIDSGALTKALTAMAVGFGQLMASFAVLNTLSAGITGGASFAVIAVGLAILSTAIVILSGAVAILAQLSWGDLLRGLTGLTVLLGVITAAAVVLSKNAGPLLLASVGLTAMAVALNLLIIPVVALSKMDWQDLGRGLAGVTALLAALTLAAIVLSRNAGSLILAGVGLAAMAFAIDLLAGAVAALAQLDWTELGRGLVGVTALLIAITAAGIILSNNAGGLILAGVGLIGIAVALNILVGAVALMAQLDWGDMARGLVGVTAALLILAVAGTALSGTLAGAASLFVMSAALAILAEVLIKLSKVKFGDLMKAIGGIAIALTVFGLAALLLEPVIPALLGLGIAMTLLGAAFALFGVGALAVAKAFEIIAKAGPDAADAVVAALEAIGAALPALIRGFAEGIIELIKVFADAAPVVAEAFGILLSHILDTLIEVTPKAGELLLALIDVLIAIITEAGPKMIQAGIDLIIAFLEGIRDRTADLVTVVSEIIVNFLNALASKMPDITTAGTNLLIAFLNGIATNISRVAEAVGNIITAFVNAVGTQANRVVDAGADAVISFIAGLGRNASRVVTAGIDTVIKFLQGIGQNGVRLAAAAFDILITFLNSLASVIREKTPELQAAGKNIAGAIIDGMTFGLASKAKAVADKAVSIAGGAVDAVTGFLGIGSPSKVFIEIGEFMGEGLAIGLSDTREIEKSAENMANVAVSSLSAIISQINDEIGTITEFSPVITPVLDTTAMQADAQRIAQIITDIAPLVPADTFNTAQLIATSPSPRQSLLDAQDTKPTPGVSFEQNIYAPEELSTSEIYKQTRNQITLAKEELSVP